MGPKPRTHISHISHTHLALARISRTGIDEVAAALDELVHQRVRAFLVACRQAHRRVFVREAERHGAQAKLGNLQARAAELLRLHLGLRLSFGRRHLLRVVAFWLRACACALAAFGLACTARRGSENWCRAD